MRQAYGDGARVHTNSWGGPTGGTAQSPEYGGYVADSQQVDLAAWEHQDVLILFSGGNAGADANGDGVLTFPEVMAHKTRAFAEGDTNQDGGLSFDEMVDVVEAELGVER